MTTKSEVFCDYCGNDISSSSEESKLTLWSVWHEGECNKLRVDICNRCALRKLQTVLNVYKLEDEFMRDVFGLLPCWDSDPETERRFTAEAAKRESAWWFVSSKVVPPCNLGEVGEAVPGTISETEEQLREEIDILQEQVAKLKDDNFELRKLLLGIKISTGTARSDIDELTDKIMDRLTDIETKIVQSSVYRSCSGSSEEQSIFARQIKEQILKHLRQELRRNATI